MQDQGLDWGKSVWLCTDRAASMAGYHLGATAKIKKVPNKNLLFTHCIYSCEHIAAQKLSSKLNDTLILDQLRLSITRDRVLHLRLFEALSVSMAAQNLHLIFHAEVIWLQGDAFWHVFLR